MDIRSRALLISVECPTKAPVRALGLRYMMIKLFFCTQGLPGTRKKYDSIGIFMGRGYVIYRGIVV